MVTTVPLEHWKIEVTESQNEWNWKSPHLVQPSFWEQVNPEQVDQGCAYLFLNMPKDTDYTTCVGRFQCVTAITGKKSLKSKTFFLCLSGIACVLLCVNWVLLFH